MEMNSPCLSQWNISFSDNAENVKGLNRICSLKIAPKFCTDLLRAEPDVPHVVTDGFGRGHRAGQLPGLDDSGASQLHGLQNRQKQTSHSVETSFALTFSTSRWRTHRDEVPSEPGVVLHGVVGAHLRATDVHLGVMDVGVLSGGVVPPDDDVLDLVGGNTAAHRHLQDRRRHGSKKQFRSYSWTTFSPKQFFSCFGGIHQVSQNTEKPEI